MSQSEVKLYIRVAVWCVFYLFIVVIFFISDEINLINHLISNKPMDESEDTFLFECSVLRHTVN